MINRELLASVLCVFVASSVFGPLVFRRGMSRKWGYWLLCGCATLALVSWVNFGDFHSIWIDSTADHTSPNRPKVEAKVPFHFHEFFHYYLGGKYFSEVGYLGLYDCTTYADREIAAEDKIAPRIDGKVRDLGDVLAEIPHAEALQRCESNILPKFTADRWESFKHDIRLMQSIAPDDYWLGAVQDAGFNPPPAWILLGGAIANIIPLRIGPLLTCLAASSLDMLLLAAAFFAIRRAFGSTAAVIAAIYFGASFIASYMWNGGAYLRFTWLVSVVFAVTALKRGRWGWAGIFFGWAACDRLFPAAFAVGAAIPLAFGAFESARDRANLKRFGFSFLGMIAGLVALSTFVYGLDSWRVFFERISHHGDVYFVWHISLKKVLTFRDWVPAKDFNGNEGMTRFRNWNLQLRSTWASMWPVWVVVRLLGVIGLVGASLKRRPWEAAILVGPAMMFLFSMPANYYYAILCIVPALLFYGAATATSVQRRSRNWLVLSAFNLFWMITLISQGLSPDDIIFNFVICCSFAAFLTIWIGAWFDRGAMVTLVKRLRSLSPTAGSGVNRERARAAH